MIRKIRDFIIGFRFKKYGHFFQKEFKNKINNMPSNAYIDVTFHGQETIRINLKDSCYEVV